LCRLNYKRLKVKILIADGSDLARLGLKAMFENSKVVEVLGEAKSSKELMIKVEELNPDVILIDYGSKDFSIDVIPKIGLKSLNAKFIGITPYSSGKTIISALKIGVDSHIKKDCSTKEITDSVLTTAKGEKFFCGELVELMRGEKINVKDVEFDVLSCEPVSLSERELEIIKLIAEGYTNAQISVVLYISNHTVNTHRKNIMKKLGVNNTAGIVMFAVKSNLVSPNKFMFSPQNEPD
jgi:DNA-binding NarL/FixJ family response regulator